MKKILSVVLTLVMVLSTFAMLVPTASAADATYNTVLYEDFDANAANGGVAFDTTKTNSDLLKAIFGDSCIGDFHSSATATYDTTANALSLYSGTYTNPRIILDSAINLSVGAEIVVEATLGATDDSDGAASRFFAVTGGTTAGGKNNAFFASVYRGGVSRVGFRMASNQWACDMSTNPSVTTGDRVKMRTVVSLSDVALYVAKWDSEAGAYGEEVLAGSAAKTAHLATAQAAPETYFAPGITLEMQDKSRVLLHSVEVKELVPAAVLPEAPAVAPSTAGSVVYTQDFSGVDATLTNAALADAIFGAGNHNVEAAGAVLSIVNGALKLDTSANKSNFQGILFENSAISNGYVAEMDYTFGNDFATALTRDLNGRFLTFTTHKDPSRGLGSNYNATVVGPFSPGIAKADGSVISGSSNARVATRPTSASAAWKGVTSYATATNVNDLGVTYRLRATVTPETLKLEVAKYTAGVLGDYVEIGTADNVSPAETLGDVVSVFAQNEMNVVIDNIKVSTLDSTLRNTFAGYQASANALRLVGVLDDTTKANATAVGFKVAILGKGELKDLACNYVYETIDTDKTAASLHAGYDYIYAMHIESIPAGEYTILVVPYYVEGGATVYGEAKTFLATIADAE